MSLKELRALVSDNAEAVKLIDGVETNMNSNVETINGLETKVGNIVETRDKYKGYLNNVKSKLGLEKLNDETLLAVANSKKGGDEANLAEIENLKTQIDSISAQSGQELEALKSQLNNTLFDKELLRLGVSANAVNDKALDMIMSELKSGVDIADDGSISYKKPDGSTIYNGSTSTPMGVMDRLEEIKASENYSFLFKADNKGGGGTPPTGKGGNQNINTKTLSPAEKAELIGEIGQEAYLELVAKSK